jgi:hypothetical protein
MNTKSLLIAGALTLASFGIASAKSYDVIFSNPTMVGNTELKAGQYKLKVQGGQAVFTGAEDSKSVSVPVKIENNNSKFDETRVETTKQNGMDSIQVINLGGSATKLEFGQ